MADGTGRKLVLLRHTKSAWPDVPDHERPLARRGQQDAPVTRPACLQDSAEQPIPGR